ncbi:MAG TPA: fibronectin type III domain-containing protein, partial [Acidimicrobiales bacterium]|nr:fibronectin type III domain-containing protein [Acidimicrobiales bacterium]
VDENGNVLIADTGDDEVEVLAVSATNPGYVLRTDADWSRGYLYVIAGRGAGIINPVPTSSGEAATADGLDAPAGVVVDGTGNVLIADSGHNLVEALAVGSVRPGYAAGSSSSWVEGDLYAVAGGGLNSPVAGGTEALSTAFDQPSDVAVDASGNVIIADKDHNEIEVLAGSPTDPRYSLGDGVVWTTGDLYVIAGGGSSVPSPLGSSAESTGLASPTGVAVDASGNVLVAVATDYVVGILAVSRSDPGYLLASGAEWHPGDLYVVAGGGNQAPSATGTDGLSTQLGQTDGVTVAPSGGVVVADSGDSEIEMLTRAPMPPEFVAATPGDGTVALAWSAPATDGGSPVTGYDVLVFSGGSSTPQETLVVGSNTTSCVVGGLTDGVSYSFEVDAFSVVGTSQPSAALGAVPESGSPGSGSSSSGSNSSGSGGSAPSSTAPSSSGTRSSRTGKSVLPRVILTKRIAPVKFGFATLSLRCNARLCGGELQLTARKVVRLKSHGRTHRVVETVLVSSDHFSIRGGAVVSLPVPVTTNAIREVTPSRHYRVVVTAKFEVVKGLNSTYRMTLVAA